MKRGGAPLTALCLAGVVLGCRVTAPEPKPGGLSGRFPEKSTAAAAPTSGSKTNPPDSDNDGIPDAVDHCPNSPETYDGVRDNDGCPEGPANLDKITVTALCEIRFARNDTTLSAEAMKCLDEIAAAVLRPLRPDLRLDDGNVAGHADGRERHPAALAKARTKVVLDYLTVHGVPATSMRTAGTGEPRCLELTETCAEQNRQVTVFFHCSAPGALTLPRGRAGTRAGSYRSSA